jgi:predicted PurR-regulated permease PerM
MNSCSDWSIIERSALFIALILIIIIGIKTIEFVFNLLVISLILTLMTIPAMDWLKKRGVPANIAVMIVTALACLFVLVLVLLTFYSFQVLLSDLPMFQSDLNQRLTDITSLMSRYGLDVTPASAPSFKLMDLAPTILSSMINVSETVMYVFFIGVTTFFMLLEVPHITHRVEKMYATQTEKFRQMSRMSGYIIDFIIVRTETNFVHGVLFGGILSIMGVHAALLWGILTFFLGYIPYLGLVVAALPAIFFAYLQYGLWGAVAVTLVVVVLNLIVENPVFSYLASRKFEMPPLVVILSVIFWGWLLGIAGMLFAVPITLMALILIQCCDDIRWVNELLGVSQLFDGGQKKPGPESDKKQLS